jgi:hypothetical protein
MSGDYSRGAGDNLQCHATIQEKAWRVFDIGNFLMLKYFSVSLLSAERSAATIGAKRSDKLLAASNEVRVRAFSNVMSGFTRHVRECSFRHCQAFPSLSCFTSGKISV